MAIVNVLKVEKIEGLYYVIVEGPKGSTILIRGSSLEHVDETERVVKNVVRLFRNAKKDPRTVPGGAAIYMQIAAHLREYALTFPGKEQVAIEAYAGVLEQVAGSLIRNYGLGWSKTLPELRSYHARGMHNMGIAAGGMHRHGRARDKGAGLDREGGAPPGLRRHPAASPRRRVLLRERAGDGPQADLRTG